ncbi:MAG: hypothetical protein IKF72_03920 [Kiritimatiellae bacterium]|nr:hypothetical protein [Kiritimatiellia bacterium]
MAGSILKEATVLFGVSLCVGAASAAITSRSYVPTGLVAQYDGINNVGHDAAHSDSATTWADLTGNGNDGTVGANVVWCENGWTNGVAGKPISVGFGLSRVTGTGTFTAQFACKPVRKSVQSGRASFFSQYSASRSLGIEHRGTSITDCIRLYSRVLDTSLSSKSSALKTDEWGSITLTADNGLKDAHFYKNLEDWGERHFSSASENLNTACASVIGGENDREAMAFFGTYNAFRLYDRVLPEEEIKINAAVDAVRYNNADWSDYPELACYTFAADGTLQQNLIAVAGEGGKVRAGDGVAAESVTGVTASYGSGAMTATFAAVPDSGYVFYRWEGNDSAIAVGSYLSSTITVTSEKGVLLTAVFKKQRRGLSSRSYVVPGLVAQYDGINNVGHDAAHDGSATTWVDLTGNGNDATKASDVTWTENGWANAVDCYPMTVPSGNGSATSVSVTTASKVFTMQYAVKPSRHTVRQCFFGQYDRRGFSLEHNTSASGVDKTGLTRYYYYYISGSAGDKYFADMKVVTDEWASMSFLSDTKQQTVWKNGAASQTQVANLSGTITNICASVIGGDNTRPAMAFCGTYNAFRLYNRVLTEDEVKVNAAVDAIRFNGASASSYTLSGGYSFAADDTLMIAMTATATTGGKVALKRVGSFEASVSSTVNHDGSEMTGFVAQPDEGYVFQRWTGDIDAIVKGSVLTPDIGVVATRPVALTAVFRKPGSNALDGMILDLDIRDVEDGALMAGTSSGYHVGDALHAGSPSSNTYYTCWYSQPNGFNDYRPMYKFMDVASPMTPFTTNAAQPCIYLTQKKDDEDTGKFGLSRWELAYTYVDAPVATFYVRFLWEGPLVPGIANDSCIFCNGYTTWASVGQGFTLRIRTASGGGVNDNKGFLNVFIPKEVPVVDYGTDLYITTNSWVDCFVSVYPSPTNVEFSNVDIWFCQTPALGSNGIFGYPVLKHKHLGDECKLPRFRSIDKAHAIRLGAETSGTNTDPEYVRKAFRGYYAALKAWDRLLTENEMWSVMADRYGGTFNVGVENGSASEFGGSWYETADPFDVSTDKWQAMKKSLTAADRTLTLVAPIPAESEGLPRVLEIVPLFDGVGAACPVTVTVNGAAVGEFDLMDESKRAIPLRASHVTRDANGKITIAITRPEGCTGTLSFDALSLAGSWQIGKIDNTSGDMTAQGQGVSSVVIAGDPIYKNAQRAVTTTYNTLTILFDVPKTSAGQCAYRYDTYMDSVKSGNTHPIHLEFNGETVWSSENAAVGKVRVEIPAESVKPGLNELKWVYDTAVANNWLTFDYHKLKMLPPPIGTMMLIR